MVQLYTLQRRSWPAARLPGAASRQPSHTSLGLASCRRRHTSHVAAAVRRKTRRREKEGDDEAVSRMGQALRQAGRRPTTTTPGPFGGSSPGESTDSAAFSSDTEAEEDWEPPPELSDSEVSSVAETCQDASCSMRPRTNFGPRFMPMLAVTDSCWADKPGFMRVQSHLVRRIHRSCLLLPTSHPRQLVNICTPTGPPLATSAAVQFSTLLPLNKLLSLPLPCHLTCHAARAAPPSLCHRWPRFWGRR